MFPRFSWNRWLSGRRVPIRRHRLRVDSLEDRTLPSGNPFTELASNLGGLTAVQSALTGPLNNASKLPLLTQNGAGILGSMDEAKVITDGLINAVEPVLNDVATNDTDTKMANALADALGLPHTDVRITRPNGDNSQVEIEIHLHRELAAATLPTNFTLNLGLPGLPVRIGATTTGNIAAKVGYDYALDFGWNGTNLFVDRTHTLADFGLSAHQLLLTADVAPSADFKATATVGLLQATVSEGAGNTSKLAADFAIDNLGLGTTPTVTPSGSANLNLHAAASFAATPDGTGGDFQFPGIGTDLTIRWDVSGTRPDVSFNKVSFELGSFLSKFVGPILRDIQQFTKPMQPINDVLTAPLPGLSDLSHLVGAGDVTLLGIAQAYAATGAAGPGFGKLIQLIGILTDVSKGINSIDTSSGNVMVPVGSFSLNTADATVRNDLLNNPVVYSNLGTPGADLAAGLFTGLQTSNVINGIEDAADKIGLGGAAKDALKKLGDVLEPSFRLNFPILDDPASVIFPMLLGRDGEMMSLDANFNFTKAPGNPDAGFSMFGVGIGATYGLSASGNVHLGYDTYGLRKFFSDVAGGATVPNSLPDLLDGFYVSDSSRFQLSASLGIAASVTYAVFSVSVTGGAHTSSPIVIAFHDPDAATDGGRLRLSRLGSDRGRILDVTGRLDAGVQVEVKVGYEPPIGPFIGFTKTFDIANVTLLDLGSIDPARNADGQTTGHLGANGIPSANPPVIAGDVNGNANRDANGVSHVGSDGILYLYLGADAGKRSNGPPTTDADPENWEVSQERDGTITVKAFGVTQNFAGVTKVVAVGVRASQTITVDDGVTIDAELTGGGADDALTYLGTGRATLNGGGGADRLAVGPKAKGSELHGGKGDDILVGGGSNDGLYGDDDNDNLFAGDGNQYLDGGAGNDQLTAGKGADALLGGAGNDLIAWTVCNGAPTAVDGGGDFNTLEVLGNDGADAFTASAAGSALAVAATGVPITATNIQELSLDGRGGADAVTVHSLAGTGVTRVDVNQSQAVAPPDGATDVVNVDAGPSTDVLIDEAVGNVVGAVVGPPAQAAVKGAQALINFRNGLTYKVFVSNAEGQDSLTLNGTPGSTITVDSLQVDAAASVSPPPAAIPLPGRLVINDAQGNTFNVVSTTGPTTINAGGGNNTFHVGSLAPAAGGTLAGITAALALNAGGRANALTIDDSGDTTDRPGGRLTGTQVAGLGNAGTITYAGMSTLGIGLGRGKDGFTVASTHAGSTSIDGGPGDDTITLLALNGPTTVRGGNDDDSVTLAATAVVGPTHLEGGSGNDLLTVDRLPVGQVSDTVFLDGGVGVDTDTVNVTGAGNYLVSVSDSGGAPQDTLVVNGTGQADNFLLRAASAPPAGTGEVPDGVAFVAALHGDPVTGVERVNYTRGFGGLVLNLGDGDDSATLDDNWAPTTVNGGTGQDHFQVGQIFKSRRDAQAGVAAQDAFDTDQTTRGFLSKGVSFETTINGEKGNDDFTVFRNTATLNLNGNDGDDTFTVRAFAEEGSTDTNVSGGKDLDLIQYVENARVNVDGGDGTDSLRIIGTEFADRYLITKDGIFGTGLNVGYKNIEKLEVDGAEGDDEFYVLSTGQDVDGTLIDVSIYGGLGNDLFSIAGDSAAVQAGTTMLPAAVQSHRVNLIQGQLHIDGAGGKGSTGGLGTPVMLPGETNQLASDGAVLAFTGTGTALSADTLTVPTARLLAALPSQPAPHASLTDLIGRTVEISKGPGLGRFWQITDVGADVGGQTVLALRSPGDPAEEWGLPNATSEFALTHLSRNFFVSEADTVDSLTVFNDGSTTDDTGALSATGLTGLGMAPAGITYANVETMEVLLGTGTDTFAVTGTAAGALTAVHGGGGGDRITVTGGGGPGSPLLVYGDTTQDRSRYSSDGSTPTAGTYQADGITPRPGAAFAFATDGNDTIDASGDPQSVAIYGGGGNDTIRGGQAGDHLAGGAGNDEVHGGAGSDHIYGDSGFNQDLTTRLDHLTPAVQVLQVVTTEAAGNDTVFGDAGDDILFGDHGIITQTPDTQRILTTGNVTRVETTNPANGGDDVMNGGADNDVALGGAGNDRVGGDAGKDLILGDQATLAARPGGVTTSPRFRTLAGAQLYDAAGAAQVTSTWQTPPGAQAAWANWSITLNDGNAGNDYLAGGADDDVVFGQAGDDTIQGDGSIALAVGTPAAPGQSAEDLAGAGSDGDDYAEGGSGSDLIFGDLGQDDLIGGSSNLYGLTSPSQRGDGMDVIFGGAGTRVARNDPGDTSAGGHARDADTILGDNGNIYRVLGAGGNPLAFTYDSYGPAKVAVRAVSLLDYTPGGGTGDLGGADVVRGEAGDDEVHGQTGNDVLFGDGQDDDLYGEAGSDRVYGGTGEDGVLGDDGRIQTSRNGQTEPLYGLTTANTQTQLSTPGPWTGAWEYITGRLTKSVTVAAWPTGGNDVIYGGTGDDFLHGGAGDDAISGAEAQAAFYNPGPVTNTNPLGYDPTTRKLAAYDANNPLRRVDGFLLNFDAVDAGGQKIEDGKDRIFGDLGNDWLVGGTGKDRLFGGKGDDMLNADDNLDTAGGLNNQPDATLFADRDFAYGGDGLDVLIANTGGDRLFDWGGEFNSYIVPFSPFGNPAVVRSPNPQIQQFLLDLARTSGADQTLTEPNDESGLFRQGDPEWGQNHGGPRDPQPGNTNARRDTQGSPEDDRVAATPAQANSTDVTVDNVVVSPDPSDPSRLALFVAGTNGNDVIEVRAGGTPGSLQVVINGVVRGTFARSTTAGTIGRVIVYGNDGDDTITINGNVDPIAAVLYGGAGNDTLTGGQGSNFLDGGDGNDNLTGGAVNDVLVGGRGQDTLAAVGGDDILIGGTYLASEDLDAVAAITTEWTSSQSYAQRLADLRAGVGDGGTYQLTTTTLLDDLTADYLSGAQGQDWFWVFAGDQTDQRGNETNN
jgi:Ca2+-binding RTX toxin-like protein